MFAVVQRTPNVREKPDLTNSIRGINTRLPWVWQDLSFAVPVLGGDKEGRRELLTNKLPTQTGTISIITDKLGNRAISCPTGTDNWLDYGHEPTFTYPSNAFTFWLRTIYQGVNLIWGTFCGKAYTVGSFSSWVLYTSLANTAKLNLDISISGGPKQTGAMATNLPVGEVVNIFGRWRTGGPVTLDVYGDGGKTIVAQKASANASGIIDWTTARMCINASDFPEGVAQHVEALCQWKRRLTDIECQQLAIDPWGWLSPRRETIAIGSIFPAYAESTPWNVGQGIQVG